MSGSKPLWTTEARKNLIDAYRLTNMTPEEFCALPRRPHPTTFREWLREEDIEPNPRNPSATLVREVKSLRRDLRALEVRLDRTLTVVEQALEVMKGLNFRIAELEEQAGKVPRLTPGARAVFEQHDIRRPGE